MVLLFLRYTGMSCTSMYAISLDVGVTTLQVLTDLNQAAGELGLGPRPLNVAVGREEGELEVTIEGGLVGD